MSSMEPSANTGITPFDYRRNLAPPFKKGQSGNPSGRPKSDLTKLLSQFVQKTPDGGKEPWKHLIIKRIIALAVQGDMEAVKFIWDRLEGKPALSVAISGSVGVFTPETLRDLVQAYHDSKRQSERPDS